MRFECVLIWRGKPTCNVHTKQTTYSTYRAFYGSKAAAVVTELASWGSPLRYGGLSVGKILMYEYHFFY